LRSVSEFIALLTILVIAVVSAVIAYSFIGGLISASRANVKHLEISVSSVEILHSGQSIQVDVGGSTFTALYIYRLTVVLQNAGNQRISGLSYQTLTINQNIKVCTSDTCDIYDPVTFTRSHTDLPSVLNPNQVAQVQFTILSKRDLLQLGYSPFVIKVQGSLPDGSTVTAYIGLFER